MLETSKDTLHIHFESTNFMVCSISSESQVGIINRKGRGIFKSAEIWRFLGKFGRNSGAKGFLVVPQCSNWTFSG